MAGGGKIRIADRDNTGELARVVNGRLLVSSTGGGGGGGDVNLVEYGGVAVGPGNPLDVQGDVAVTQTTSPWVVSGTVAVSNFPATQAVTQSTSPWVVSGTVDVTQSTHANLNANVRLQDGDSGALLDVIKEGSSSPAYGQSLGLVPLARYESGEGPTPVEGAWNALSINEDSRLRVESVITDVTTTLLVKEIGVSTLNLSGSTNGRPIQITGTGTASSVLIHTATSTSGEEDRISLWVTNRSSAAVKVTFEWGTTGTASELVATIPAEDTVPFVLGPMIGGAASVVIRAFAGTANVCSVIGSVERFAA